MGPDSAVEPFGDEIRIGQRSLDPAKADNCFYAIGTGHFHAFEAEMEQPLYRLDRQNQCQVLLARHISPISDRTRLRAWQAKD